MRALCATVMLCVATGCALKSPPKREDLARDKPSWERAMDKFEPKI